MGYRKLKIKFTYIFSLLFIIGCYILLPVMNSDYLFEIQEHSLWVKGHTFMVETVNDHGGWLAYIGAYLTQYFYYPWLGATILIVFWLLIFFLLVKLWEEVDGISRAKIIPYVILVCLPFHVLSLDYWIYYAKSPGYAFIPTLLTFGIAFAGYIINQIIKKYTKDRIYRCINGIILLVITISIFFSLRKYTLHFANLTALSDKNYRTELSMYRAIDECRWQDVLDMSPKINDPKHIHPTNLMIMLKNIALLNTDQLLDQAFEYDNCGTKPTFKDSLKIKLATQAGPMLYYHHGFINYAYRWAIENSIKYYPTVDNMKMLIRCAIFNQDFDVAMKYISILKNTTFHRKWALEHEAMIMDNRLFMESEEYRCIAPLLVKDDELDNDHSDIEQYIYGYYSNYNSSVEQVEELSLISSLTILHEEEFMIHFYNFVQNHPSIPAPKVLQEAAYLIGPTNLSPIDISQYPFDIPVKTSFSQFNEDYHAYKSQGMSEADIAEKMQSQFGSTYWWYYYFHTDLNLY